MHIDPDTQRLGWSLAQLYKEEGSIKRQHIARGTIFGKGTGSALVAGIANEVQSIQEYYNVEFLVMEDYLFLPGRTCGVFAIPALIGVLKTDWYRKTGTEAIMVEAYKWKRAICRNGNANKMLVKESLRKLLGDDEIIEIEDEYNLHALKEQQDPQDCFDAIAIDWYVYKTVLKNMKEEEIICNERYY